MQVLSTEQLDQIAGGLVVDRNNVPDGIIIDQNGNPWTRSGIPLFSVY